MAGSPEPRVRLQSIFCQACHNHVTTVALEAGPSLIRHQSNFKPLSGERVKCRQSWVAVPDASSGRVDLIPVDGRHQADEVLRTQTAHWLESLAQALGADPVGAEQSEVA